MAIQAAPAVIARRDHCHDNGALAGLVGTCLVEVCEGTLALGPWGESRARSPVGQHGVRERSYAAGVAAPMDERDEVHQGETLG